MYVKSLIAGALLASTAMGSVLQEQFRCGTPEPTAEQLAVASEMLEVERAARMAPPPANNGSMVTIPTYFHVVVASENEFDGGKISDAQLMKQLQVMNKHYGPYGYQFKLMGMDRTVDIRSGIDNDEMAMRKKLRKGNYSTLNVYFQTKLRSDALGYCFFPTDAAPNSEAFLKDGCSIFWKTIVDGPLKNYNLGGTVTHEIGHWMGLFHTFQGGCSAPGDMIDDTPAEASPASGCPTGRDSCPKDPGTDPITNFMDYSYDACYQQFTPQQSQRMRSMWQKYRQGK